MATSQQSTRTAPKDDILTKLWPQVCKYLAQLGQAGFTFFSQWCRKAKRSVKHLAKATETGTAWIRRRRLRRVARAGLREALQHLGGWAQRRHRFPEVCGVLFLSRAKRERRKSLPDHKNALASLAPQVFELFLGQLLVRGERSAQSPAKAGDDCLALLWRCAFHCAAHVIPAGPSGPAGTARTPQWKPPRQSKARQLSPAFAEECAERSPLTNNCPRNNSNTCGAKLAKTF